jgi:hypothetical protein
MARTRSETRFSIRSWHCEWRPPTRAAGSSSGPRDTRGMNGWRPSICPSGPKGLLLAEFWPDIRSIGLSFSGPRSAGLAR